MNDRARERDYRSPEYKTNEGITSSDTPTTPPPPGRCAMTHDCPATGCDREIPYTMLMCRSHWYMVPGPLRSAVWNAWQDGAGAGTAQHTAAIDAAIRSVNEKLAAKGITSTPGGKQ